MAAAIVVVIAGVKAAESILVPFLLSVLIALIVSPFLAWMRTHRVPSLVSIALIISLVILVGLLMGALLGTSIADFKQNMPLYQEKLNSIFGSLVQYAAQFGLVVDAEFYLENFNPGSAMNLVVNTLGSLGGLMSNAFLILLTVAFILAEEVNFTAKLASARPNSKEALEALNQFADSVIHYLGIKTLTSLLTGFIVLVWLMILGIDYPLMWAVLAFLLNFIPTIGSIIAAVPAVLLALVQFDFGVAGLAALGYVVINTGVGNILEPRWMGKGLNLSPLVVFLSLVFWGWVMGTVGMLLSIPLTIVVKIALENDPRTRWLGVMMGTGNADQSHSLDNVK